MSDIDQKHQTETEIGLQGVGGPEETRQTAEQLAQLLGIIIPADSDYYTALNTLQGLMTEASTVVETARAQRDQAIRDKVAAEKQLTEDVSMDIFDNLDYDDFYDSERAEVIRDMAEAITLMLEWDTANELHLERVEALTQALMDASDLPNNQAAQSILRELLAKVSGESDDE